MRLGGVEEGGLQVISFSSWRGLGSLNLYSGIVNLFKSGFAGMMGIWICCILFYISSFEETTRIVVAFK